MGCENAAQHNTLTPKVDLRKVFTKGRSKDKICRTVRMHWRSRSLLTCFQEFLVLNSSERSASLSSNSFIGPKSPRSKVSLCFVYKMYTRTISLISMWILCHHYIISFKTGIIGFNRYFYSTGKATFKSVELYWNVVKSYRTGTLCMAGEDVQFWLWLVILVRFCYLFIFVVPDVWKCAAQPRSDALWLPSSHDSQQWVSLFLVLTCKCLHKLTISEMIKR